MLVQIVPHWTSSFLFHHQTDQGRRDKLVILVKQHNEDTSIVCCIKIQADRFIFLNAYLLFCL